MNSKQAKLVAVGVGASAAVVMGALGVTFASAPDTTGNFGEGPEVTLGETSTEEAAPTEPATTFVTPPVTAEKPDGYDVG